MTRRTALSLAAALPTAPLALGFQRRLSPHETASTDVGGKSVTITYGRPYLKGRKVGEVTPFGQVWRLGADEATKISVPAAMKLGTLDLATGSYALFAITSEQQWTMIVNTVADQWGAFSYDATKDLGRFIVPVVKLSKPVEEFTIAFDKQGSKSAKITFAWGGESVSTTLTAA